MVILMIRRALEGRKKQKDGKTEDKENIRLKDPKEL
jgi:hypothetical protein